MTAMSEKPTWKNRIIESGTRPASDFLAHPDNWRVHPKTQQDGLEAVLDEVGWVQNVVVSARSGFLLDGHARIVSALRRGDDTLVPYVSVDLTEDEERLILASLDPLSHLAVPDKEKLSALLSGLPRDNPELSAMLDRVANSYHVIAMPDGDGHVSTDDADALLRKWAVGRGQVWLLNGRHRILCGDATNESDVTRLLGGDTPQMMVTDPPFGVEYDPAWRVSAAAKGRIFGGRAHARTNYITKDKIADWSAAFQLFTGDIAYVWSAHGDKLLESGLALQRSGFQLRAGIVWVKSRPAISRGHYSYQHECLWYCVRKGRRANWIGPPLASTVWEIPYDQNVAGGHAAQKPVECMARPIRYHDCTVIYDPFVGSGTTIVASEQLGRTCLAMEIEPRFVAIALERCSLLGMSIERQSESEKGIR